MSIFSVIKWLFSFLANGMSATAATEQTRLQTQAATNVAAIGLAGREADAHAQVLVAREGRWWSSMPATMIGLAIAFHLWAVVLDSVFLFSWDVAALPKPMDVWEGAAITLILGGGIADRLLGRR